MGEDQDPILAIHGAESDFVPERLIREMKRRRPQMASHEVAGTGHMPMLMSAGEIDAIICFLTRPTPAMPVPTRRTDMSKQPDTEKPAGLDPFEAGRQWLDIAEKAQKLMTKFVDRQLSGRHSEAFPLQSDPTAMSRIFASVLE